MTPTPNTGLRHSLMAAICAVLFSTTCLMAATTPVSASLPQDQAPRMAQAQA